MELTEEELDRLPIRIACAADRIQKGIGTVENIRDLLIWATEKEVDNKELREGVVSLNSQMVGLEKEVERLKRERDSVTRGALNKVAEVMGRPKPFDLKDTDWGDTSEKQLIIWQEIAQERQEVISDLQSQLDTANKQTEKYEKLVEDITTMDISFTNIGTGVTIHPLKQIIEALRSIGGE